MRKIIIAIAVIITVVGIIFFGKNKSSEKEKTTTNSDSTSQNPAKIEAHVKHDQPQATLNQVNHFLKVISHCNSF